MPRHSFSRPVSAVALTAVFALSPSLACSAPADDAPTRGGTPGASAGTAGVPGTAAKVPAFTVKRMVKGYSHVWDVASVGSEGWIFTERESAKVRIVKGKAVHNVKFPSSSVWASGETGLMGIAVDPAFTKNRRFYTCQGGFTKNG
ncbi:MAG: PQQ-dependent sugar dehydrogenase, partial [Nocardioidaceae bacterium]|nr:PQQ-dependent sugar dehydrogenase [Nocardioidaceae bacterium]